MERVFYKKIESNGIPVRKILSDEYHMSSSLVSRLKNTDGILINGKPVWVSYTPTAGDVLEIIIKDGVSEDIKPVEMPLDIRYEDEDIIIISKPPFMPCHPSPGHYEDTLANGLMAYFGGDYTCRFVNRLDKNTSGLLAAAKNPYAHDLCVRMLHTDKFIREYSAVVDGILEGEGVIDAPIARCGDSIIKRRVSPDGKRAVTRYESVGIFRERTLLRLRLETGRTHQIRVHCAYIGCPLTGDWLYGRESAQIKRHALHSCRMELDHPITGKRVIAESEIADDMKNLLTRG